MKNAYYYESEFGKIGIAESGGAITNLFFHNTVKPKEFQEEETPLLAEAAAQLNEYLRGERRKFELRFGFEGTEFEKMVWNSLLDIPYGEVRTYGQIARQLGRPQAYRAVGRANGLNPISIFVPCHRVIGAGGKLTGYAGGLEVKRKLLALEGIFIDC